MWRWRAATRSIAPRSPRSSRGRRSASSPGCSNYFRRTAGCWLRCAAWRTRSSRAAISFTRINPGIRKWNSSRAFCEIAKANPGSCGAERRRKWTSWFAPQDSRKWRWKWTSGGCSRFRWLGASEQPFLRAMARMANAPRTRSLLTAIAASAGLSALFVIVYGWCNWFTAQRANVPTLFFEWERSIPFVPLMIVPYMSIDLFFVAAPFLCRSDRERAAFSKRIAAAILIGGVCFLLFPLRFAFERPHAAGWLGTLFDWFRGMDQPYNLLPSLHIALRTILADLYARQTRGLLRQASNLWFVLIGLSAVLTYQHHVLDVVAGFALGV